jgi:hypothetical protein
MADAPARRWKKRTYYDRYGADSSSTISQVPGNYTITRGRPGITAGLVKRFNQYLPIMPYGAPDKDRYYEEFFEPHRHEVMSQQKHLYGDAMNALRTIGRYKYAGMSKNSQDMNARVAQGMARYNPMASDIPEMAQHYLPTSKRTASAASGLATGFNRAKEMYKKASPFGNPTAQKAAAVSALRGMGEGIINARPGGKVFTDAYANFFNAELLKSQGAPQEEIDKQIDLGLRTLSRNPELINQLPKFINQDIKATDYAGGTWGKNEVGKYFTEPVNKQDLDENGAPIRRSIWNRAFTRLKSMLSGKKMGQSKKENLEDLKKDIAHLTFDKNMAFMPQFRTAFTRMSPIARSAAHNLSDKIRGINVAAGNTFKSTFDKGFDRSQELTGIPIMATPTMGTKNGTDKFYNTRMGSNLQKITAMPQALASNINSPKFQPPVGLEYKTSFNSNSPKPFYNTAKTSGFWTRTPQQQQASTPVAGLSKPYPDEYINKLSDILEKEDSKGGGKK